MRALISMIVFMIVWLIGVFVFIMGNFIFSELFIAFILSGMFFMLLMMVDDMQRRQ